jgi:hypothetical protein
VDDHGSSILELRLCKGLSVGLSVRLKAQGLCQSRVRTKRLSKMATSPFLSPEMTEGDLDTNVSFCLGVVFHSSCAAPVCVRGRNVVCPMSSSMSCNTGLAAALLHYYRPCKGWDDIC